MASEQGVFPRNCLFGPLWKSLANMEFDTYGGPGGCMLHAWRHEYSVNNSIPPKQDVFARNCPFGPVHKSLAKHRIWHTHGGSVSSMICAWRHEYIVDNGISPKHGDFPKFLVNGAGENAIKPFFFWRWMCSFRPKKYYKTGEKRQEDT